MRRWLERIMAVFNGYCIVKDCPNEAVTGSAYCLDHQPWRENAS